MLPTAQCSLREAITSANLHVAPFAGPGECAAGTGGDTITLPSGRFVLSIPGRREDNNDTGDLDIVARGLTIQGAGASLTTIDANHLDRAFDVGSSAATIAGVTVTGGLTQSGASGADKTVPFNVIGGNGGEGEGGGGILNTGTLTLQDSIVTGNTAGAGGRGGNAHGEDGLSQPAADGGDAGSGRGGDGGAGGDGGGIYNFGTLTLTRATVTANFAGAGGPGGVGTGGAGGGTGSSTGGAGGGGSGGVGGRGSRGGGIFTIGVRGVTLEQSSVSGNAAGHGGSGGPAQGGGGGPSGGSPGFGGPAAETGGKGGEGGRGGGIDNEAGSTSLTSSLLQDNTGGDGGDGGSATGGHGGSALGTSGAAGLGGTGSAGSGGLGGNGGAISAGPYLDSAPLAAANVTMTANTAGPGGRGGPGAGGDAGAAPGGTGGNGGNGFGGVGAQGGSGGGVWLMGSTIPTTSTILHATIAANAAGAGGSAGTATRGHAGAGQIPGSPGTASSGGPGLSGSSSAVGIVAATGATIQNSIVESTATPACGGVVNDGGHDIAFSDASCPGSHVDPLLQPLADNGGPTKTLALSAGSPAIDQVPASGAGCPATDQRGVARPQGASCDIGTFELTVIPRGAGRTPRPQGVGGTSPPQGVGTPAMPTTRAVLARLSHITLSPASFRAAPTGPSALAAAARAKPARFGTNVSYSLNEAATVRFSVARPATGRRAASGRCVAPNRRNGTARKCTRLVVLRGSFTRQAVTGANHFRFTGRVSGRRLKPGTYRLTAIPIAAGRRGPTTQIAFRIIE